MGFCIFCLFFSLVFLLGPCSSSFDQNFNISWGNDHVFPLDNNGNKVQLTMDEHSGCGFISKQSYGSGFFRARLKLPDYDSTAVVTTYYLHSHTLDHDELDLEFLGGSNRITLQTNVYANGIGSREERIKLWFDPTSDFHNYSILWNEYQIVFYVDNIPIRVFKNNKRLGVGYPTQPMFIEATLWDGEGWASNGKPVKWEEGPFKAVYEGFEIEGCPSEGPTVSEDCGDPKYTWNGEKYRALDPKERRAFRHVRRKYMTYDYCRDRSRFPKTPIECQSNRLF